MGKKNIASPFKARRPKSKKALSTGVILTTIFCVVGLTLIMKRAAIISATKEGLSNRSSVVKETRSVVDPDENSLESLTVVSMNLSGCKPSAAAPSHWNMLKSTDAVKIELLKSKPDILALQECPSGGITWAERVFPEYKSIGAVYSHCDQVVLLVRRDIFAKNVSLPSGLPAVAAELQWKDRRLLVASIHLAPFAGGEYDRRRQVQSLLQKASTMSLPLILAGDTNMRVKEDSTMEQPPFQLLDAWKVAGSKIESKWTWDTRDHTQNGGFFNRYYGDDTKEYKTRYDRIYIHTTESMELQEVQSFELIANRPVTNKYHFLSDHFGMSTRIILKWNQ